MQNLRLASYQIVDAVLHNFPSSPDVQVPLVSPFRPEDPDPLVGHERDVVHRQDVGVPAANPGHLLGGKDGLRQSLGVVSPQLRKLWVQCSISQQEREDLQKRVL